jgi:hypothetical protein
MTWIIIISVLVLTLLWILLGPVIFFVDTEDHRYCLNLPGIFSASVVPGGELFRIRFRVFFVPFGFDPFSRKKKQDRRKPSKKPGSSLKEGGKPGSSLKEGLRILASFRIRKLYLDIDTDDFMWNAFLIPAFSAVNTEQIRLTANFEGRASLLLDARTRLGTIVWAFIVNHYKSKFNR